MGNQTIKQTATLLRLRNLYVVEAPPDILSGLGSVRISLRVGLHLCHSYAFRRSDVAACVVPASAVAAMNLHEGDRVEIEVTPQRAAPEERVPPDLAVALSKAGADLTVLTSRDRKHLLRMVRESRNPAVRQHRIEAAVAACLAAAKSRPEARVERTAYDPSLFTGTAAYYALYRPDYPQSLFEHLVDTYQLGPDSRVLDLGCGTGQLGIPLARYCKEVVCMDPDTDMVDEARQAAGAAGVRNISFTVGSSWDLSPAAGTFDLTVIGDAFHWMDRDQVLSVLFVMTEPGGGVAVIGRKLSYPEDCQAVVEATIKEFLGEQRRAGQGVYTHPAERHEVVLARSRFQVLPSWQTEYSLTWGISDLLGYLYSTSYANKRLFGDQVESFEQLLRSRLAELEPSETFPVRVEVTALLVRKAY